MIVRNVVAGILIALYSFSVFGFGRAIGYSNGLREMQFYVDWFHSRSDNPAYGFAERGCTLQPFDPENFAISGSARIVRVPEIWACPDGSTTFLWGDYETIYGDGNLADKVEKSME